MSAASDRASCAADAIAWGLLTSPGSRMSISLDHKKELLKRADGFLEHYREDAECDPATFTHDFFLSLEDAMIEVAADIASAEQTQRY